MSPQIVSNAREGAEAPPRANCLRREVEHGLQLLRSLLELVAPDERQCRDDADRRDAGAVPSASACEVRDVAIVDSTAMPSAPPICCVVLNRPDARPASAWRTPASAAIEIGTKEKPRPTPTSRKPGSRSLRYVPWTETCVKYTSPLVSATIPLTSTGFTPMRVTSCAATADQRIALPATARYATPVFMGE